MVDPLGDIIKKYEREADYRPDGSQPIVMRLDGKNFSKYTKKVGCMKPFDTRLAEAMKQTTMALVLYCDADIGYTQSDEITLIMTKKSDNSQLFMGGRFQKLCSVLASVATATFAQHTWSDEPAYFDCRVFEVPDKETAIQAMDWRAEDCRRNSVSCLAQKHFSHKQLDGKKTWEMKEMLKDVSPWLDMPEWYRNGVTIRRTKEMRRYDMSELADLPEKHHARQNPDLEIERTVINTIHESILDAEDKHAFVWG